MSPKHLTEVLVTTGIFILFFFFFAKGGNPTERDIERAVIGLGLYLVGVVYFYVRSRSNPYFKYPVYFFTGLLVLGVVLAFLK